MFTRRDLARLFGAAVVAPAALTLPAEASPKLVRSHASALAGAFEPPLTMFFDYVNCADGGEWAYPVRVDATAFHSKTRPLAALTANIPQTGTLKAVRVFRSDAFLMSWFHHEGMPVVAGQTFSLDVAATPA